jgi:hypothetical protein
VGEEIEEEKPTPKIIANDQEVIALKERILQTE